MRGKDRNRSEIRSGRAGSRALIALAAALASLTPIAARAAPPPRIAFHIEAGSLSDALIALGGQARITIAATDPGLRRIRARPVAGRMDVAAALRRLLAGTGYSFVLAGPDAVRIVPAAAPPRRRPPPPPAPAAARPAEAPAGEIIVTASKQGIPLSAFPGTAHVLEVTPGEAARAGGRGSDELVERLPMLSATNLGASRNKLFIRGIADSSFNGASQSVSGQYLGDVRLTFNAPDPDLRLYDVGRAELLEGPQGTLYGSGALGGILRIVPNPPNFDHFAGNALAGLSATEHGAPGGDAAAMLNLPIVPGQAAIRMVGYDVVDGGYIDDLARGLRDVNRTTIRGGRAVLLFRPKESDWQIELGALAQFVAGRDGQYGEHFMPALTRRSVIAQPFDNDYFAGHFTLRRSGRVDFSSTTELVRHNFDNQFDATGFPGTSGPIAFREDSAISMIASETRLSHADSRGAGWVAGLGFVHDIDRIDRNLGPPGAVLPRAGVRNAVDEGALFGQYGLALLQRLVVTAGGRLTYAESRGNPLDTPNRRLDEPTRRDLRFSPSLSLGWQAAPRIFVYARYQDGFRAGGLGIGAVRAAARRYISDDLASTELGARFGRESDKLSFDASVSHAIWTNMQADLIDSRGLPFTANIGTGRIDGLEATLSWRPIRGLRLDAAAFLDDSALTQPNLRLPRGSFANLPNIAEAGARAGGHFDTRLSPSVSLELNGDLRYVGKSQLGVGTPLDIIQGNYVETNVGAQLGFGRYAVSVDVTNLADTKGNSFAFGNPFQVMSRDQITPLRPRTFRLGLAARF
jgi:iron complex outermembrane receptor protein